MAVQTISIAAGSASSNRLFAKIQRLVALLGKPSKGARDNQELDKGNFQLSGRHAFTAKNQKNQNQDADERLLTIHTTIKYTLLGNFTCQ
jgi:hypothetical protein